MTVATIGRQPKERQEVLLRQQLVGKRYGTF